MTGPSGGDVTGPDLAELERLHAAATPGPWHHAHPFDRVVDGAGEGLTNLAIVQSDRAADAALIVAAVNALPGLLAAVDAADTVAGAQIVTGNAETERWGRELRRVLAAALGEPR